MWNLWDLAGSYRLSHVLELTFGMKNLSDHEPPFSNQAYTFQNGYDPRYTDFYRHIPSGRLSYSFWCRREHPAGMADKPVDGYPATRFGGSARLRRRPDLVGC